MAKKETDVSLIIVKIIAFLFCSFLLVSLFTNKNAIFNDYNFLKEAHFNVFELFSGNTPAMHNPVGILGAYSAYFLVLLFGQSFAIVSLFLVLLHLSLNFAHASFKFINRLSIFFLIFIFNSYILFFYYHDYILLKEPYFSDKLLFTYFYNVISALLGKSGTLIFSAILFILSLRLIIKFNPFKFFLKLIFSFKPFFIRNVSEKQDNKKIPVFKKPIENPETEIPEEIINPEIPVLDKENPEDYIPDFTDEFSENPPQKQAPKTGDYQINLTTEISEVYPDEKPLKTGIFNPNLRNNYEGSQKYIKPDIDSFLYKPNIDKRIDKVKLEEEIKSISQMLIDKLAEFGIEANVLNVNVGPIITQYELEPAPGIKVNRFVSLSDDLALALKAKSIRVQAPIPGRGLIGVEVPNKIADVIYMRDIFFSTEMHNSEAVLSVALGKDIAGRPIVTDLAKMPHLLIAGATGSGKSVCINTIICSLLLRCTPEEVRLVMIDPKRIELSGYEDIPHLIQSVVTDPEDAMNALNWAVYEMERRYELLQEAKVRDIVSFNYKIEDLIKSGEAEEIDKLPYIVLIVDEFADLIMTAGREIELPIARLAQMARAVGIHLILATQRPSIKVITGVIKANFPARIAFRVSSKVDSRVILDSTGADKLLGRGDMLFLPPGKANPERIHGAFLSDSEIEGLVEYLRTQPKPRLDIQMSKPDTVNITDFEYDDELFPDAAKMIVNANTASVSMLQRHFKIGYARAGRLIDLLERAGVIGPHVGSKSREVLMSKEDLDGFNERIEEM